MGKKEIKSPSGYSGTMDAHDQEDAGYFLKLNFIHIYKQCNTEAGSIQKSNWTDGGKIVLQTATGFSSGIEGVSSGLN